MNHASDTDGVSVCGSDAPAGRGHPLGPLVYRCTSADTRSARKWAAFIAACGVGVLVVAAFLLEPDPRGYGTHAQLFGSECGLIQTLGVPCPSCGMTTAFAHAVRGHWLAAFDAQPAGLALCLATMVTTGVALSVLFSGKVWHLNWYRATPLRVGLVVAGLLLGGWAYKIARVLTVGHAPAPW